MDFIAQFITEILLEYPGAFVRWLVLGKKEKFSTFTKKNKRYNYLVSVFVIILIIIAIQLLISQD